MLWLWIGFVALILGLLALDLGMFHRSGSAQSLRRAAAWSGYWIALGLGFSGWIYLAYEYGWFGLRLEPVAGQLVGGGLQAVLQYLAAYLLEKSLSVDNLFVMALIFASFRVAPEHQHRVLFWGIVGALVARGALILGGIYLVERFTWLFPLLGAYLLYLAIRMLRGRKDDPRQVEAGWLVRLISRIRPIALGDHGGRLLVRQEGRLAFTPLFLALVSIEGADLVFALDSVPAALAVSTEPFLVMSSNIFAILGLRSLYLVLSGMLSRFHYLGISLALILAFIGLKMVVHGFFHIPTMISLLVIVAVLAGGVFASLPRLQRAAEAAAGGNGGGPLPGGGSEEP